MQAYWLERVGTGIDDWAVMTGKRVQMYKGTKMQCIMFVERQRTQGRKGKRHVS